MTINCTGDGQPLSSSTSSSTTRSAAPPFPAGSTLVVYLSPNNGAINNNAGGDDGRLLSRPSKSPTQEVPINLFGAEWFRHAPTSQIPSDLLVSS